MEFKDIQAFIEQNKDNAEVKAYLQGLNLLTVEGAQKFLSENHDAKKWFDSEKDKHFTKGLETWMQKTFPTKVEEEIAKRYPPEDPRDKKIRELEEKFSKAEREKTREALKNKALAVATEKKLPVGLVEYFLGDDEEKTLTNITKLEEVWGSTINTVIEERLKGNNYVPPGGDGNQNVDTSKMTMEQYAEYWRKQNEKK